MLTNFANFWQKDARGNLEPKHYTRSITAHFVCWYSTV